jgi:hypothetical protein
MGLARSTYGGVDMCVLGFGGETCRKKTDLNWRIILKRILKKFDGRQ